MNFRSAGIGFLFMLAVLSLNAQGFLHAEGSNIVDGSGENFIIRSIGTGNWMIQEGYMMKSSGVAGTQHEYRQKLEQSIGIEKTEEFYASWLDNHFTKRDLDSMKTWGFNSVRPALHYLWFTPPIEEEADKNVSTWLERGFRLTDSLVKWCTENEMYVIFDMHGAPGGQGKDSNISDYDPSKPSLWEDEANKRKLVALWRKIAERYADEPWVGGYDLINETNWTFPEGNNSQLRDIYMRITDTIREVDPNHIIFIEGNWFANDFSGLTPPWDDNLVYSFHKYWSFNGPSSLSYATWIRDDYNVPLWLGETGENSNTWFTNLVSLAEKQNIGWSWWPVKKGGLNNVMKVQVNSDYQRLIASWKGEEDPLSAEEAFAAVMTFSENHRAENCEVQYDVIDALIRQPNTRQLKAFRKHTTEDYIFAADYAMGRNSFAYYDKDTANYRSDTDEYVQWNQGGAYRNDGVDIQPCSDTDTSNGFNVGWIEDGEWLTYLVEAQAGLYDVSFRTSGAIEGAYALLEANGKIISDQFYLPPTGGWDSWRTTTLSNVLLPDGEVELKIRFVKGGVNLNYIRFINKRSASSAEFTTLLVETREVENELILHLNKSLSASLYSAGDFLLKANGKELGLGEVSAIAGMDYILLEPVETLQKDDLLTLDYMGNGVNSDGEVLGAFQNRKVLNNIVDFHQVPGKIEAESYYKINGLELEECLDEGGGYNTAYASPGDYVDFVLDVEKPGTYRLDMRVALQNGNANVEFLAREGEQFNMLKDPTLRNTGGWQTWDTQTTSLLLPGGKVHLRLMDIQGEFNLNWMELSLLSSVASMKEGKSTFLFPNPAEDQVNVSLPAQTKGGSLTIMDAKGAPVLLHNYRHQHFTVDTSSLSSGLYLVRISEKDYFTTQKLLIN